MGILDNLENAWDDKFQFESNPIIENDAMGRPILNQEYPNLSVRLFSETCCSGCTCGK